MDDDAANLSPFPQPRMQCRGCGKAIEDHHPRYCYPSSDRAIVAAVSLAALCVALTAFLRMLG